MAYRKRKHGYCNSCGKGLVKPANFAGSCTLRCAAVAWAALQGSGHLDGVYCEKCGNSVDSFSHDCNDPFYDEIKAGE
jgi:uncharacterized OB-fold protein